MCVAALLELAPDAIAAHMGTPAGLRSLQAAAQQLRQLQQELREQQREQRRWQRQAVAAGQLDSQGEQSVADRMASGRQTFIAALRPLALVRLFAALAAAALQAPGGSIKRVAAVCHLLDNTLPALAAAAREGADALPQLTPGHAKAWGLAERAFLALGLVLAEAAGQQAQLTQRTFDSAATALLAALQLRALMCALEGEWRRWAPQAGGTSDYTVFQHMPPAASGVQMYSHMLAGQIAHHALRQGDRIMQAAQEYHSVAALRPGWRGRAASNDSAVVRALTAEGSQQLSFMAQAHACCASLVHLLTAEAGPGACYGDSSLPATLSALHLGACMLWRVLDATG